MYDVISRRFIPQLIIPQLAATVFGVVALGFGMTAAAQTQFTVTRDTDASGSCAAACSLRQALSSANASTASGAVKIVFNISGCGTHVINVSGTTLRATRPVNIDGSTQPRCSSTPTANSLIELRGPGSSVATPVILHGLLLDTGSGNSQIRGLAVNGFSGNGISLKSSNNFVDDVKLGTDATGTIARPNSVGIEIGDGTTGNDIGDSVISGNVSMGVNILGDHTQIFSNMIGPAVDGTQLTSTPPTFKGNGGDGIATSGAFDAQIGIAAAIGNTIAFNSGAGVHVGSGSRSNEILGNKIHDNGGAGIRLDGGSANQGQVAPVINTVTRTLQISINPPRSVTTTTVTGSIGNGNTSFQVDLYRNDDTCPAAPALEGELFLATGNVNANGTFSVSTTGLPGNAITAVARDPEGNTSVFSVCKAVP